MTRKRINCIRRIVLLASFLCFFAAVIYLLFHYAEQQMHNNTIKSIQDIAYFPDAKEADLFEIQEDPHVSGKKKNIKKMKPVINFKQLTAINKEVCAWLKIPGTNVDYPVLYHEGDNEYYLHKDLYQKYSSYGSLYFAQGCIPIQKDVSLLVYGHHMKDGSMFAELMHYKQKKYYENHPYIYLYSPEYNYQYQIAAVIDTDVSKENPDAFYCDQYIDIGDSNVLQEFAQELEKRELYHTDVTLLPGDQFLMLSTCEYSSKNGRLVVVARQTARKKCG